jgi:hypothetical protein
MRNQQKTDAARFLFIQGKVTQPPSATACTGGTPTQGFSVRHFLAKKGLLWCRMTA